MVDDVLPRLGDIIHSGSLISNAKVADLRIENPHIRDSLVTHLLHNFVVASFRVRFV